jgi:hypothetical protein
MLRELVGRCLSRRLHRHHRGFATGQLREWERDGFRSAKKPHVGDEIVTGVLAEEPRP